MRAFLALIAALWTTSVVTPPAVQHRSENESASRLLATAERFGPDFGKFRRRPIPQELLDKHANTIRTLRAQIISNPPPVWAIDSDDILEPTMPPFRTVFRLYNVLTADAFSQHAKSNDVAAWADLHAMWILSRSLYDRPEWISVATANIGRRMIASVASQIGVPPAWFTEFKSFDARGAMQQSIDYEAWLIHTRADRYPLGEPDGTFIGDSFRTLAAPVARPIRLLQAQMEIDAMRRQASK